MKKRIAWLLSIFMIAALLPVMPHTTSADASGQCGDNLYWSYDESKGALTITGSGDMDDYNGETSPWVSFAKDIKSVSLPDGLTHIGCCAFTMPWSSETFSWCSSLESVFIPESVTSIGFNAFYACVSLASITIPDGVETIERGVFYECRALESVSIPNSVTSIDSFAFSGCESLLSVTIPDSVTSIGDRAFQGTSSLTTITIPANVINIGEEAFAGCRAMTAYDVDVENVKYRSVDGVLFTKDMDTLLFYPAAKNQTVYEIPNGVTNIGTRAFSCAPLVSVTMPEGLTCIGDGAFDCCYSLAAVSIPNGATSIGDHAFGSCTSLTSIIIPESMTSIGRGAFSYCSSLLSIVIPNNVIMIDEDIFYRCTSLTSIAIPYSVLRIGDCAFSGCTALMDIYYHGTEVQKNNIAIEDYNETLFSANWHYLYGQIDSKSLTLDGKIMVNFYVKVSDDVAADAASYANLTLNGVTTTVPVSDATISIEDGVTRRRFSQDILAKEMNDPVSFELFDGSGRRLALFDAFGQPIANDCLLYAASDYALAASQAGLGANLEALVDACLDYGAAAQLYFDYNDDGLSVPAAVTAVTENDLSSFAAAYSGTLPAGIDHITGSLLLEADNSIRQYFYLKDGYTVDDFTFRIGTETITPTHAGQRTYYLEVKRIPAQDLDQTFTFSVSDTTDTYTIAYCALSYAYKVLSYVNDPNQPQSIKDLLTVPLQNLAKAIYRYNQAAHAYFG